MPVQGINLKGQTKFDYPIFKGRTYTLTMDKDEFQSISVNDDHDPNAGLLVSNGEHKEETSGRGPEISTQ